MATFNINETPVFLARIIGADGPSNDELTVYKNLKNTTTSYYGDLRDNYKKATGTTKDALKIELQQIYGEDVIDASGNIVDDVVLRTSYGFGSDEETAKDTYELWKSLDNNSSRTDSEELLYSQLNSIMKTERTSIEEEQYKRIESKIKAFLVYPDEIKKLSYSIKNALHYGNISTYVTNHENVTINLNEDKPFTEALIDNDDIWTIDNIGYNFKWSPKAVLINNTSYPPFPTIGAYCVEFKLEFNDKVVDGRVITPSTLTWKRSVAIINE